MRSTSKYLVNSHGVNPHQFQVQDNPNIPGEHHNDHPFKFKPLRDICITGDLEVVKFLIEVKGFHVTRNVAPLLVGVGTWNAFSTFSVLHAINLRSWHW
jgi:hypothetical protein